MDVQAPKSSKGSVGGTREKGIRDCRCHATGFCARRWFRRGIFACSPKEEGSQEKIENFQDACKRVMQDIRVDRRELREECANRATQRQKIFAGLGRLPEYRT